MFALKDIKDIKIPEKTLCLTFDDGPGPYSLEIGKFLHEYGIRATFFVVGKFAIERPDIVEELHNLGHIIGNHTFEHPDMPYYVSINGNVQDQLIRTNELIHKFNKGKLTYFRAPYGKWSPEVAHELNTNLRTSYRFVGPVYWDIEGIDCYYWKLGKTVQETIDIYLKKIDIPKKGILVMHDHIADMDTVQEVNKTHELVKQLIPILLDMGYKFIGLDEIEDPQLTSAKNDSFALLAPNGNVLQYDDKEGGVLTWSDKGVTSESMAFSIEYHGYGKVALKTENGNYLRVNADENTAVQVTTKFNEYCLFDDIPVDSKGMQFRTYNGNYLSSECKSNTLLKAEALFMHKALTLRFMPLRMAYIKPVTFSERINRMKKQWKFIKSKLLQS